MSVTALLKKAITQRKRVRMDYTPITEGHLAGIRTIEPHALGKTRKGHAVVRAFVTRGVEGAQKEWRMFRVSQIENPELLPQSFSVKNDFNPKDKHMRPRPLVAQTLKAPRRSARIALPRRSARLAPKE
jgi:predicted DNA-binding transcriptional regulator YafY